MALARWSIGWLVGLRAFGIRERSLLFGPLPRPAQRGAPAEYRPTRKGALALAVVLGCSQLGCSLIYQPVRLSTYENMPAEDALLQVPRPSTEVASALLKVMEGRGFPLVYKGKRKDGQLILAFRGPRHAPPAVTGNPQYSTQTYQFGSFFAAGLQDLPDGTLLALFGKPTVQGVELCADADVELADLQYWCRDSSLLATSPLGAYITGREEQEVIRGVLGTLQVEFVER